MWKHCRCLVAFAFFTLGLALSGRAAEGAPREMIPLATWGFAEDTAAAGTVPVPLADAKWQQVAIPHIFRLSGLPDNSAGWYHQEIATTEADRGRRIFLLLEGAATVKDVFINGKLVGQHKGAYTAAVFDLTPALAIGKVNQLDLRVGNRDAEIQGLMARSTLYFVNGGMYRKAWLIKTGAVHIAPDMGSSGVYLTPTAITATQAELGVRTVIRNSLAVPVEAELRHRVTNPAGAEVASFGRTVALAAGETISVDLSNAIANPKLWDLGKPNFYTVRTELRVDGKLSDVVTERTGIRTIAYQNKRFQLNGREVQFRGVNKHAQDEYVWNAIDDGKLRQEWQWMLEMGVNAVRLAHYPHSRLEYDIADEHGIAVWAENGYAGHSWTGFLKSDTVVTSDGERQTREMVRQNWNHPSILFWSCGNETITAVVTRYADVIREEKDPGRLVTYANSNGFPKNCDFIANNTYDGWYGNTYDGFKQLPRNALVSESGASCWPSHHVPYGTAKWTVNKYEPEEYTEIFTEYRLQALCRNDIANRPMFFWWNFREFYDAKFKNNRNSKGLVTLAGLPKDIVFLFQAFLRPETPVVHLNGRFHFLRRFAADNGIKAYANVPELELTVNGVVQGKKKNGEYRIPDIKTKSKDGKETVIAGIPVDNVFFWKASLAPGRNVVEVADGAGHRDRMIIYQQPVDGPVPVDPQAVVQDLRSSNPASPAIFIDRPVEAQAPFYTDVDGSSDNTFDILPAAAAGASWIGTRRLSDEKCKTDLSFRIRPGSADTTVMVMFSTGTFPVVTLKKTEEATVKAAAAMTQALTAAGFADSGEKALWRDHNLNRCDAALWSRTLKAGETLTLPGQTLDYLILVKPAGR
jgi:beta-galactosidase